MEIIGLHITLKKSTLKKQGCEYIIVSKLFKGLRYKFEFFGNNKFNNLLRNNKRIIP